MATMPTITVIGWRSAKTIGFMEVIISEGREDLGRKLAGSRGPVGRLRRSGQVAQFGDVDQSDARHLSEDGTVPLGRQPDHHEVSPHHHQFGMHDILGLAGRGDESDRGEGPLSQAGLKVGGGKNHDRAPEVET